MVGCGLSYVTNAWNFINIEWEHDAVPTRVSIMRSHLAIGCVFPASYMPGNNFFIALLPINFLPFPGCKSISIRIFNHNLQTTTSCITAHIT
jgi:hypothetical protein